MNRFLALLFLVCTGFALTLGNYWYTFGLWPKSWASFWLFALLFTIQSQLLASVVKGED